MEHIGNIIVLIVVFVFTLTFVFTFQLELPQNGTYDDDCIKWGYDGYNEGMSFGGDETCYKFVNEEYIEVPYDALKKKFGR